MGREILTGIRHRRRWNNLEQTGTEIWRTADSGAVNVWDGRETYVYQRDIRNKIMGRKEIKKIKN